MDFAVQLAVEGEFAREFDVSFNLDVRTENILDI